MENLNKQGGEKTRKMETKTDSKAHAPTVKTAKAEEKPAHTEHAHDHAGHEHSHEGHDHAAHEHKPAEGSATETKKPVQVKPVKKKEMACIRMNGIPASTKQSRDLCRFIKGKTVQKALEEMERVARGKMAVKMRGEIPHRKGPMMAGRFPMNSGAVFVKVLKSLAGNAAVAGIANPEVTIASASWASRPQRKGGRKFKRTHLYIEVREARIKAKKVTREEKQKMHKQKTMEAKK
jgi:ribosomal protein L22